MSLRKQAILQTLENDWKRVKRERNFDRRLQIAHLAIEKLREMFGIANRTMLYAEPAKVIPLKEILMVGDARDSFLVKLWCMTKLDLEKYKYSKNIMCRAADAEYLTRMAIKSTS